MEKHGIISLHIRESTYEMKDPKIHPGHVNKGLESSKVQILFSIQRYFDGLRSISLINECKTRAKIILFTNSFCRKF